MNHRTWGTSLLWATGIVTALAVAAGVWIIDSPAQQRLQRLDESRLHDLRMLDMAARSYREKHDVLPPDQATLTSQPGAELDLHDPTDGTAYRYRLLDATHFELCATFATSSADGLRRGAALNEWAHPAGEHCFRRTAKVED